MRTLIKPLTALQLEDNAGAIKRGITPYWDEYTDTLESIETEFPVFYFTWGYTMRLATFVEIEPSKTGKTAKCHVLNKKEFGGYGDEKAQPQEGRRGEVLNAKFDGKGWVVHFNGKNYKAYKYEKPVTQDTCD